MNGKAETDQNKRIRRCTQSLHKRQHVGRTRLPADAAWQRSCTACLASTAATVLSM